MTWTDKTIGIFLSLCLSSVSLAGTISRVTKPNGTTAWITGDLVTPTDLNGDFDVIVNAINGNIDSANLGVVTIDELTGCAGGACSNPLGPQDVDDYSFDEAEGNNEVNPGVSGVFIAPTTLQGELERLRYAIRRAAVGINVQRENGTGALVPVDWWELPARGQNLIVNPAFQLDTNADGLGDGWTMVDAAGGGSPTLTLVPGLQIEGYGTQQRIDVDTAGDGISQVVTRLKASTLYLIMAKVKVAGVDVTNLTVTGALATGQWRSISTNPVTFTSTGLMTKGAVVKTTAVPANLTVSLISTDAADDFRVAEVGVYELNEDMLPRQLTDTTRQVRVAVKWDCVNGAWTDMTGMTQTVTPPTDGYSISVAASLTYDDAAGTNQALACQIEENGVAVAGPIMDWVSSGDLGNMSITYNKPIAVAGTALVYTVACYCTTANMDFQPNHATFGQTASEMSVEMRRN